MRRISSPVLLIAALAAGFATSAFGEEEFLKGEALQAEIAKSCAEGCVVLNRQEAENLTAAINAMVQRNAVTAFDAGKVDANQSCRNRI